MFGFMLIFAWFFILERRDETCCTIASRRREEEMLSGSDLGDIVVLSHLLQFPVQFLSYEQNERYGDQR